MKRMNMRYSNETGGEKHRHVHLEQGRARKAQVYPRRFCIRICEGIAAQKKKEILGVQSRPIMSMEEMQRIAKSRPEECPGAALHEDDGEKWVAFDDVTGQRLDPELMKRARKDEIAYFREMEGYKKVDIEEC